MNERIMRYPNHTWCNRWRQGLIRLQENWKLNVQTLVRHDEERTQRTDIAQLHDRTDLLANKLYSETKITKIDKEKYQQTVERYLEETKNLTVRENIRFPVVDENEMKEMISRDEIQRRIGQLTESSKVKWDKPDYDRIISNMPRSKSRVQSFIRNDKPRDQSDIRERKDYHLIETPRRNQQERQSRARTTTPDARHRINERLEQRNQYLQMINPEKDKSEDESSEDFGELVVESCEIEDEDPVSISDETDKSENKMDDTFSEKK
jgi:hypothetical protein